MRTLPTTNYERRTTNPFPSPAPECYQRAAIEANRRHALKVLGICLLFALLLVPVSRGIRTAMHQAELAREQAR